MVISWVVGILTLVFLNLTIVVKAKGENYGF